MNDDQPVFVVFNPQSGKGKGAGLITPVLDALSAGGRVEHGVTTRAGEETTLTSDAIARGFRTIVAVGGDGTWSNVANAILSSGRSDVRLGLIAGGTGCDLAKSLGIPGRDVAASVRIIREGRTRTIDVGRIEGKFFLNVAGFGFDVAVLEDSWRVRYLSGSALYTYCALRQLYAFPGFPVEIAADGGPSERRELMMLIVANARVFGGGFQIAPGADLSDGRLDAVSFGNMNLSRRLRLMSQLRKGTHGESPEVQTQTTPALTLRFETPPAYETDGEWNRAAASELRLESVPAALQVLTPGA